MRPDAHTVLIVEEDPSTLTFLADNLAADGFNPVPVGVHQHALSKAATQFPDIAIVSVNGGSGRTIVQAIRAGDSDVDPRLPVVLTGADRTELEAVRNLNLGADDYVPKPFHYPELHARVNALLRRVALDSRRNGTVINLGSLVIDTHARTVNVGDRRLDLSRKLYKLLVTLASEPHRTFTKQELLRDLWSGRDARSTRTLDTHASRLRRELNTAGDHYVQNVWGVGYRLLPS